MLQGGAVWIGLTDTGHEGTFIHYDGTPVDYFNWGENNLDNDDNDYVYLTTGEGKWFTTVYTYNNGERSICKKLAMLNTV